MRTFAIVGAGFTGTMTAVHLLRLLRAQGEGGSEPARVMLFERTGRFTAGVAYGTTSPAHVLNVPAGRMSAFEDDPDHFLRWARERDPSVVGGTFVQRRLFGQYLQSILAEAEAAAESSVQLRRVPGRVAWVRPSGHPSKEVVRLGLDDGEAAADTVVLAIGNYPPADPSLADTRFYSSPRYVRDPWSTDALNLAPNAPIVLLGTGLTMVDMALSLRERKHQGPIYAISRRGLLPQAHRISAKPPPHHDRPAGIDRWERTALGLLRALRAEVEAAAERGVDWREVVTSIRADTPALWTSMSIEERRRFLRHVRPFWETHRHRSAPAVAAQIDELVGSGQLRVIAGRITAYREDVNCVSVEVVERASAAPRTITAARVVNCTGPETDVHRVQDDLVRQLVREGLVRPDQLGLGLDTTADGSLVDAEGRAHPSMRLVGPLRKGQLWENTAVPELRVEVAAMARSLVRGQVTTAAPVAARRAT